MSFVNLFVLVTTANYPDVMMPAFSFTKAAPIFFTIFLLIGLYAIFNIFLAFVYGFYQVCSSDFAAPKATRLRQCATE
jgi:two pore calcium channel protein 1